MITVTVTTNGGHEEQVLIDRFPDNCPICHFGVEARFQKLSHYTKRTNNPKVEIIFQCPRQNCQSFFIATYSAIFGSWQLYGCFPFTPLKRNYSEHIQVVSPKFCAIENEAYNAERQGWKLVAGPAYRKALEFLIKDYLCGLRPDDAEAIKHLQLGPCIKNYVRNENLKVSAERAVWLGNDETHYARKWEDKDLEDLKRLIDLTVRWIEMEEMTKKALGDMPTGKN